MTIYVVYGGEYIIFVLKRRMKDDVADKTLGGYRLQDQASQKNLIYGLWKWHFLQMQKCKHFVKSKCMTHSLYQVK
jgi:hypothetical protein